MKVKLLAIQTLFGLLIATLSTSSFAQFVGDVFFVEPSVVVQKNETGQLNFALFSGDKALGAVAAEITFDPTKLQIVDIEPVRVGKILMDIKWRVVANKVEIVVINGQSRETPFGSVILGKISVKAIGNVGDQTHLSTAVSSAYTADRNPLRQGTGFGGEVNIGQIMANISQKQISTSALVSEDRVLSSRALQMRPAGHRVILYRNLGGGHFVPVSIGITGKSVGGD